MLIKIACVICRACHLACSAEHQGNLTFVLSIQIMRTKVEWIVENRVSVMGLKPQSQGLLQLPHCRDGVYVQLGRANNGAADGPRAVSTSASPPGKPAAAAASTIGAKPMVVPTSAKYGLPSRLTDQIELSCLLPSAMGIGL